MGEFVAYYRVSTDSQGVLGLGIEAQKQAVSDYLTLYGGTLYKEYIEVESGANSERDELSKAIKLCLKSRRTLLVATLDRLSRDAFFIFDLMQSKVSFVACDRPHANEYEIMSDVIHAKRERDKISERTKLALAEKKKQGFKLGSPEPEKRIVEMKAANQRYACEFSKRIWPMIQYLRSQGFESYASIARELNNIPIPSRRNREWYPSTVKGVVDRMTDHKPFSS